MERLYSKIVGMPVFSPESVQPIYIARDMVVDPDSGKVVAIVVDSARGLIITPMDIVSLKHGILIRRKDDVVEMEDVLRVKDIVEDGRELMGKNVETENGERLGKVVDLAIDAKSLILNKIHTARSILGIVHHNPRIIPAKNIVEVLEDKVIVKDSSGEVVAEEAAEVAGAGAV